MAAAGLVEEEPKLSFLCVHARSENTAQEGQGPRLWFWPALGLVEECVADSGGVKEEEGPWL